MAAQFVDPRLQPGPADGGVAVKHLGKVAQWRTDPTDDLKDGGMLRVEVCPMDNALVMEHTVAQVADAFPSSIQFLHVTLPARRVGEYLTRERVTEAGPGVGLVEKTGPKAKVKFSHHTPGRVEFAIGPKSLPGLDYLLLLPCWERSNNIIPSVCAETHTEPTVDGVAQGNLGDLER